MLHLNPFVSFFISLEEVKREKCKTMSFKSSFQSHARMNVGECFKVVLKVKFMLHRLIRRTK